MRVDEQTHTPVRYMPLLFVRTMQYEYSNGSFVWLDAVVPMNIEKLSLSKFLNVEWNI